MLPRKPFLYRWHLRPRMASVKYARALVLVATVLGVTFRAVYAAPLPIAQLKAAQCCREHCHHEHPAPRSDDCCHVTTHAGDSAVFFAKSTVTDAGRLVSPGSLPRLAPVHDLVRTTTRPRELLWPGPPLFLTLRALRL
jgi:hypothetical protein